MTGLVTWDEEHDEEEQESGPITAVDVENDHQVESRPKLTRMRSSLRTSTLRQKSQTSHKWVKAAHT